MMLANKTKTAILHEHAYWYDDICGSLKAVFCKFTLFFQPRPSPRAAPPQLANSADPLRLPKTNRLRLSLSNQSATQNSARRPRGGSPQAYNTRTYLGS